MQVLERSPRVGKLVGTMSCGVSLTNPAPVGSFSRPCRLQRRRKLLLLLQSLHQSPRLLPAAPQRRLRPTSCTSHPSPRCTSSTKPHSHGNQSPQELSDALSSVRTARHVTRHTWLSHLITSSSLRYVDHGCCVPPIFVLSLAPCSALLAGKDITYNLVVFDAKRSYLCVVSIGSEVLAIPLLFLQASSTPLPTTLLAGFLHPPPQQLRPVRRRRHIRGHMERPVRKPCLRDRPHEVRGFLWARVPVCLCLCTSASVLVCVFLLCVTAVSLDIFACPDGVTPPPSLFFASIN